MRPAATISRDGLKAVPYALHAVCAVIVASDAPAGHMSFSDTFNFPALRNTEVVHDIGVDWRGKGVTHGGI